MAILNNNPLVGASGNQGGYNISNSLRFRSSASAKLTRTPASSSNRKTWTWSGWVKLGAAITSGNGGIFGVTGSGDSELFSFRFESNTIKVAGNVTLWLQTTQVFRDPSAWYHIVLSVDTTQTTSSNRFKLYINGNQVTALSTANYPSQNADLGINRAVQHNIYADYDGTNYLDGYLADVNFIDGQALTPSSFGETDTITGVWKPKAYSGTYGTNGFYLKFSDIATTSGSNAGLGKDFSGNSNYWTTNNISVTAGTTYDAMTDSPTLTSATVANYCVLNPLIPVTTTTVINGNLGLSGYNGAGSVFGTLGVSSGKWYFEYIAYADAMGGISGTPNGGAFPGAASNSYTWDSNNATKYSNSTGASYGSATSNGDIVGVAFDLDSGSITFYKNNVSQGVAYTFTPSGSYFPAFRNGSATNTSVNFGQRPFSYTPPTGFVALNTFNLPTSTIVKGNSYFDSTLYTGNGSTQSITNAGAFRPDFVWIKRRDGSGQDHVLQDSNRGFGGTTKLASSSTAAENVTGGATGSEWGSVTAANSNGFSITASTSGDQVNKNTWTYVGWQWQAGQGSTSSNTSGSITSTVSVNTTAGFSVVTYTGSGAAGTVGHGLGVAPAMIITKKRTNAGGGSAATNWVAWHKALSGAYSSTTGYIYFNDTAAAATTTNFYDGTAMTSTTFRWQTGNDNINYSNDTFVSYCWAEIAGFSRFTSYTGNGSADGVFVYLGFRPKFVMIKRTDTTNDWNILNSSQQTYNQVETYLLANLSNAEGSSGNSTDFLSNGFKLRTANAWGNASGGTYIVAAWAENPFKNSNAR